MNQWSIKDDNVVCIVCIVWSLHNISCGLVKNYREAKLKNPFVILFLLVFFLLSFKKLQEVTVYRYVSYSMYHIGLCLEYYCFRFQRVTHTYLKRIFDEGMYLKLYKYVIIIKWYSFLSYMKFKVSELTILSNSIILYSLSPSFKELTKTQVKLQYTRNS